MIYQSRREGKEPFWDESKNLGWGEKKKQPGDGFGVCWGRRCGGKWHRMGKLQVMKDRERVLENTEHVPTQRCVCVCVCV